MDDSQKGGLGNDCVGAYIQAGEGYSEVQLYNMYKNESGKVSTRMQRMDVGRGVEKLEVDRQHSRARTASCRVLQGIWGRRQGFIGFGLPFNHSLPVKKKIPRYINRETRDHDKVTVR